MSPALALTALLAGADPAPRLDADGFPLPPGAVARIGSSRFRPGEHVAKLAYSPDGKYLAGETLLSVHVWDATTGRHVLRIDDSKHYLTLLLGFSLDGVLITARRGESPRPPVRFQLGDPVRPFRLIRDDDVPRPPMIAERVEVPSGRVLTSIRLPAYPQSLTLSPDGRWVAYATADRPGVAVASTLTGRELWRREGAGFGGWKIFTPDGRKLTCAESGEPDSRAWLLDALSGREVASYPADGRNWPRYGRLFSPDGKWLVAVEEEDEFEVWDMTTRRVAFRPPRGQGGTPFGFLSPTLLAVDRDREAIEVWDLNERTRVATWKNQRATGIAVCPTGGTVAAFDYRRIDLLDAKTGERVGGTPDPEERPAVVGFTARGTVRIEYFGDSETSHRGEEWDPRTRTTEAVPRFPLPERAVWSPDGSAYLVREGNTATLCDGRTGRQKQRFVANRPLIEVFAHRSGRVFGEAAGVLFAWGPDGRLRATIPVTGGGRFSGKGYAVLPDGAAVATWRETEGAQFRGAELTRWSADTGARQSTVRAAFLPSHLEFARDGRRFVARFTTKAADSLQDFQYHLGLFDGDTGRLIRPLPAGSDPLNAPYAVNPDGRTVAVGWDDGTLAVAELATGRVRTAFRHEGRFLYRGVQFSPDGRLLIGTSWDAPVLVWDARGGAAGFPTTPPDAEALAAAWADLDSEDAREAFAAVRLFAAFPGRSLPLLRKQPPPDELRAVRAVEAVEWMGTPEAVKLLEAWAGGAEGAVLTTEARAAVARLRKK